MSNEDLNEIFKLNNQDFRMILEGLESLKSKDFAGDLMGMMIKGMLVDKKKMNPVQLQEHEEQERRDKLEEEKKKVRQEEIKKQIDLLKAKITLIVDFDEKRKMAQELQNPERQLS